MPLIDELFRVTALLPQKHGYRARTQQRSGECKHPGTGAACFGQLDAGQVGDLLRIGHFVAGGGDEHGDGLLGQIAAGRRLSFDQEVQAEGQLRGGADAVRTGGDDDCLLIDGRGKTVMRPVSGVSGSSGISGSMGMLA